MLAHTPREPISLASRREPVQLEGASRRKWGINQTRVCRRMTCTSGASDNVLSSHMGLQ